MAEFERFFKIEIENADTVYRNYATVIDGIITPADMGIAESSMSLDEVLCSGDLRFGEYNSNKFEIKLFGLSNGVAGPMPDVTGFTIMVTDWGTADSDTMKNPIFVGTIDSATTDDKNGYRNIVAYDSMYKYKDIDIGKDWELFWNENEGEHKTRTLKEIREAVCDFVGIQTVSLEQLADSSLSITITDDGDAYTQWISSEPDNATILSEPFEPDNDIVVIDGGLVDEIEQYLVSYLETKIIVDGEQINVIRLNSGSVFTYLQPNKAVTDYTLTFYHRGDAGAVSFEDIENPQNSKIFTVGESTEYVRYEFDYDPTLNQDKLVFSSQGISYYKNISVSKHFPNDSMVFCYRDYQPGEMLAPNTNSITFSTLLSAICELQCVCPNINRQGQLEFISPINEIKHIDCTDDYAKNDTTFEDYLVLNPTGFDIYANSNTHLLKYPDTDDNSNPYIIGGNIFLVTVTEDQARELLSNILPIIRNISYTPANISMIVSNLNTHLGDNMKIIPYRDDTSVYTNHLIMSQSLSGPLLVDQLVECRASGPNQSTSVPSQNDSVVQGLTAKEYNSKVDELETKVKTMVTKDTVEIEISKVAKEISEAGAEKVVTKGKKYVFDDSGINVADPTSEISTVIAHNGMEVSKANGSAERQTMLKANNQGVDAQNLHATTYLIVGSRSRLEKYKEDRIGCFMMN